MPGPSPSSLDFRARIFHERDGFRVIRRRE
jgi:hypothetical protein